MGLLDWLGLTGEVERAARHPLKLAAFYWNGGNASAAMVRDISDTGAYILAPEHWYLGTILTITLQFDTGENGSKQAESVTVLCKVVRNDEGGMGVHFLFAAPRDRRTLQRFLTRVPGAEATMTANGQGGQALIEFALMVPLLFLLIFSVVNFGGFLYSWITVSNAARAGVQDAAMGASYAGFPAQASSSYISTLIQNETVSLPGTTPTVTVCQTGYIGASTTLTWIAYPQASTNTACSITPAYTDPETVTGASGASYFTTVMIDVSYTYNPFVSAFKTKYLGTVTPPTTVHRQVYMRLLN